MKKLNVFTSEYDEKYHAFELTDGTFLSVRNDLLKLQSLIEIMVKEIKNFDGDKRQKADERIDFYLRMFVYAGGFYENFEEAIRELARRYWKNMA
jgi:hypothetical protein